MKAALKSILGLAAILILSAGCVGREPEPDWRHLVAALGDPNADVRDRAAAEFLAMGDSAVPSLALAARDTDPEVSARARELIEQLETLHWSLLYEGYDSDQKREVIFECKLDGSGEKILTDGRLPSLSPDGQRLAFLRSAPDRRAVLRDLLSGTEKEFQVREEWSGAPAWSPDGKSLAWITGRTREIVLLDSEAGRQVQASDKDSYLSGILGWSSDSSGVWVLDGGYKPRFCTSQGRLFDRNSTESPRNRYFARNPGGTLAFFSTYDSFFSSDLWIRDEMTGGERCILKDRPVNSITAWDRAGSRLLVSTGVHLEPDDLGELDPASGEIRNLTEWTGRTIVSVALGGEPPVAVVEWTRHERGGFHTGPPNMFQVSLIPLDSGSERELDVSSMSAFAVIPIRRP